MAYSYLYSIGHGNKTIEELISALRKYEIKYLIDVRSKPYSKFYPQFNQENLRAVINATGDITYGYMGDQIGGLPENDDLKTDGHIDYEKMKANHIFQVGLARLISANNQKLNTCIMCSESNPAECHRSKLIGEALYEKGIDMHHICKNHEGKPYLKSQKEVVYEANNGNNTINLFGEVQTFQSRKTY